MDSWERKRPRPQKAAETSAFPGSQFHIFEIILLLVLIFSFIPFVNVLIVRRNFFVPSLLVLLV